MIDKTAQEVSTLNQAFIEKIAQGGIAELAKAGGEFICETVHEEAFTDKVLPSVDVTPDECITDEDSDTLYKLVPKKPDFKAVILNTDGEPEDTWVRGRRVKVPFFMIETEILNKTKGEILAMERPVIDAIQEDLTKHIADRKDEKFLAIVDYAIANQAAPAKTIETDAANYWDTGDLTKLLQLLDKNRLVADKFLVTRSVLDYASHWQATDVGDAFRTEAMREGWNGDRLLGRQVVKHIKDELTNTTAGKFRVIAFATEFEGRRYCGVNYTMQDGTSPLMMFEKLGLYSWKAALMCTFDIINVESVAVQTEKA